MTTHFDINTIFLKSESIIDREVGEEIVLVTMDAGISDIDSTIYSLNKTGKEFWMLLDGQSSLKKIVLILSNNYNIKTEVIKKEILNLANDLLDKGLIFEKKFK